MSNPSSFRAELARRGGIKALSQSVSASRTRVHLSAKGDILRPIDVVRILTQNRLSLRAAHAALIALSENRPTIVEMADPDLAAIAADLGVLGVLAVRSEPPNVDVRAIRTRLGLSQHEFALRFGLETSTVQNWEQGRNHLDGAARILVAVIAQSPDVVERAVLVSGTSETAVPG